MAAENWSVRTRSRIRGFSRSEMLVVSVSAKLKAMAAEVLREEHFSNHWGMALESTNRSSLLSWNYRQSRGVHA